jgi:hypothetical protein
LQIFFEILFGPGGPAITFHILSCQTGPLHVGWPFHGFLTFGCEMLGCCALAGEG